MRAAALLLLALAGATPVASEHPIKHLVVLMMENRSFDHLLGWLKEKKGDVDGLTGEEFNIDPNTGDKLYVTKTAPDCAVDDPLHGWADTTLQVYGFKKPVGDKTSRPDMSGFVKASRGARRDPQNPIGMFTPETAPIMNALAEEFVVFNRWFPSVPGPTDPNRAFAMSGTSNGMTSNFNQTLWNQQSYFDVLTQHNKTWRAYYQDDPWAVLYFDDVVNKPENHKNVHTMDQFFADAAAGDLPQFTWLQPRMNAHKSPPNWQHPDASVREGERLYKQVYETLRASPAWKQTAFVLTYDEHGGFYDHVAPPQDGVPAPDGVRDKTGFEFDRLGVRIPTLLVSPWAPRGLAVGRPAGPTPTSEYDGTSTIATASKIFGVEHDLGARAAWAGTFEGILSQLTEPREDCPMTLPELPDVDAGFLEKMQTLPLNGHLEIQVGYYCKFNGHGEGCGKNITNMREAGLWLEPEIEKFMGRLRARQQ